MINGKRQCKHTDVDLAAQHGYSPQRRSLIWNVGARLIMATPQVAQQVPHLATRVVLERDLSQVAGEFLVRLDCGYRERDRFRAVVMCALKRGSRDLTDRGRTNGILNSRYGLDCQLGLRLLHGRGRFFLRAPQKFLSGSIAMDYPAFLLLSVS